MARKKEKESIKAEPLLTKNYDLKYHDLTKDQQRASDLFDDWLHMKHKDRRTQVLRIGGVAGSGKSYLIKYILDHYKFDTTECYVVAYTGQAVNNLRQAGIMAKTIHSTFMHVKDVQIRDKQGNPVFRSGIPLMKKKFSPIKKIPSTVKCIICDEASFISEKIEDLMCSYGVPVLEIGDPIQLPPVTGQQCFTDQNLDYFLDTIMRQEAGSEIIDLATRIRHYDPIDTRAYWNDVTFMWAQETIEDTFFRFKPFIKYADMIVVGTNRQRFTINNLYREYILKTTNPYPRAGEKLVCRKNDWSTQLGPFPLTNGTKGKCLHDVGKSEVDKTSGAFLMDFKPDFIFDDDYFDALPCDIKFLRDEDNHKDMSYYEQINPWKKFEYAYALTAHTSQGSQQPTVVFMDSFGGSPEYHMRLRYTAVTRAEKHLYYILPYSSKYPQWTDLWKGGFKPNE